MLTLLRTARQPQDTRMYLITTFSFFFNDTATPEIYTLSLHDALPISPDKAAHPYAAPLGASRLAGVAPALLLSAEDDPLRDESETYARRLREAGVTVRHGVLPAPSGWPFAFAEPLAPSEAPAWAPTVVAHLKSYFASVAPARRAAASAHSMLA